MQSVCAAHMRMRGASEVCGADNAMGRCSRAHGHSVCATCTTMPLLYGWMAKVHRVWRAPTRMRRAVDSCKWSRGVTVSTLDPESSDRGSNPRETCERPLDLIAHPCPAGWLLVMAVLLWWGSCRQLQAPQHCQCWGRPEVQLRTTRLHAADLASQTAVCAWLVSWCNG